MINNIRKEDIPVLQTVDEIS